MTQATSWDPECYAKSARFVSELGEPLLQLLEPAPGEFILDLGCGDGVLTQKIASYGCKVIGVDSSFLQLRAAKERGLKAVTVMDGHSLGFKPRLDAVFTNAALHWMKQPEKLVAGVANSLEPRGRFVGELGGKGNVGTIRSALHAGLQKYGINPIPVDPWYYPSLEETSELLSSTGFTVDHIVLLQPPTKLPGDILGWFEVFAQPFTQSVPEMHREDFLADVRDGLAAILKDRDGNWVADYVRLRFKAFKASRD